jgi:deoxycytidine triphosphate deaminase
MFEPGRFVAEHIEPVTEEQVQPNGVDLTLETVYEQVEPGRIHRSGKTVGDRRELDAGDGTFALEPGGYIAGYGETVSIPPGHVGFIFPRSSLMRNSCMLNTAVWDAGYVGRGEGLLQVFHEIEIETGARIAQMVYARAEHSGAYEGTYQGENLGDSAAEISPEDERAE